MDFSLENLILPVQGLQCVLDALESQALCRVPSLAIPACPLSLLVNASSLTPVQMHIGSLSPFTVYKIKQDKLWGGWKVSRKLENSDILFIRRYWGRGGWGCDPSQQSGEEIVMVMWDCEIEMTCSSMGEWVSRRKCGCGGCSFPSFILRHNRSVQ